MPTCVLAVIASALALVIALTGCTSPPAEVPHTAKVPLTAEQSPEVQDVSPRQVAIYLQRERSDPQYAGVSDSDLIGYGQELCRDLAKSNGSFDNLFANAGTHLLRYRDLYIMATATFCRSRLADAETWDRDNPPTHQPVPSVSPDTHSVTYGITGNGNRAMITWATDGGTQQGTSLALPWTVTALTEIPQFCSPKFPTPGRFRS